MHSTFKFLSGVDNIAIMRMFYQCAEHFVENEDMNLYMTPFKYQFRFHNVLIKNLTYRSFPDLGYVGYTFVMKYQNYTHTLIHINPITNA